MWIKKNYSTTKNLRPILFLALIAPWLVSSCAIQNTWKNQYLEYNCQETLNEYNLRHNLFKKLDDNEIKRRQKIKIPAISRLEDNSVFSQIVENIKNAPKDAKFIPIDLRYYKDVDLTNIIISNESDFTLLPYLYSSKYSQGFFSIININQNSISIYPPEVLKFFKPQKIYRPDLAKSEIIINVSHANSIFGNMKFSKDIHFSLIANNITKPFRLDLREASNMQFNLNRKWIMPLYSLENSVTEDNKITTAYIKYVNNSNAKIRVTKFYKSETKCYTDDNNKFNIIE